MNPEKEGKDGEKKGETGRRGRGPKTVSKRSIFLKDFVLDIDILCSILLVYFALNSAHKFFYLL